MGYSDRGGRGGDSDRGWRGGGSGGGELVAERALLLLGQCRAKGLYTQAQCLAYLGKPFRVVLELPEWLTDAQVLNSTALYSVCVCTAVCMYCICSMYCAYAQYVQYSMHSMYSMYSTVHRVIDLLPLYLAVPGCCGIDCARLARSF